LARTETIENDAEKSVGKYPLARLKKTWEENIKMDLSEVRGSEDGWRLKVAQDHAHFSTI
jgi:hypothetical protein